jgi:hypothetical protein
MGHGPAGEGVPLRRSVDRLRRVEEIFQREALAQFRPAEDTAAVSQNPVVKLGLGGRLSPYQ